MSRFNRDIPYNDLLLLPPKEDIETKNILRKTISVCSIIILFQLHSAGDNLENSVYQKEE
jgi:hypothetical protein